MGTVNASFWLLFAGEGSERYALEKGFPGLRVSDAETLSVLYPAFTNGFQGFYRGSQWPVPSVGVQCFWLRFPAIFGKGGKDNVLEKKKGFRRNV